VLWLCLRFPYLPIELRAPDLDKVAVTDRAGARRVIIAANEQARSAGIHPGMQVPHALLREPELRLMDRSRADERRALRALADWSLQFSSTVHLEPARWMIWLEIGASLRYFDGLLTLRSRIELGIGSLHYSASVGIAPSLEAAALFALAANVSPATDLHQIKSLASTLPLTLLALDQKVIQQLLATGLKTTGEVLDIPTSALARRFGPQTTLYLQRLLGKHPDPRKHYVDCCMSLRAICAVVIAPSNSSRSHSGTGTLQKVHSACTRARPSASQPGYSPCSAKS
jgi:protein ImuB